MKDRPYEFKVAGTTVAIKRDTSENWRFHDPVLRVDEAGYDLDENKIKIGDGVRSWTELPWFAEILEGPTTEDLCKVIEWLWFERHNITTARRGGVHLSDMPPNIRYALEFAVAKGYLA